MNPVDFRCKGGYAVGVQDELPLPDHDSNEIEEKAVRRSDLIRAKFGNLAKFLETFSTADSDETCVEETYRASGKVKRLEGA